MSPNDGQYAMVADVDITSLSACGSSEGDWVELTKRLDETKAFESSVNRPVVYARINVLLDKPNTKPLALVRTQSEAGHLTLDRGSRYKLVASYRFPLQAIDQNASLLLTAQLGKHLVPQSGTTELIAAESRRVEVGFYPDPFAANTGSNIGVTFVSNVATTQVLSPDVNLPALLQVPLKARIILFPVLALYAVGTTVLALDLKELNLGLWPGLLLKIGAGAAQVLALYLMITWYGKKFV